MKVNLKIIFLSVLTLLICELSAQKDYHLLPFSNKLLLNPSFAGLNNKTSLWTGIQVFAKSNQTINNQFSLTYDTYSDKLNGGIAFYFQQGLLGEINTNTTEVGFSYAGFAINVGKGKIISSFNTHFLIATKQWFVHSIDFLLDKEIEPPSPPGEEFSRYYAVKPRFGILLDSPVSQLGMAATAHFKRKLAVTENQTNNIPVRFILYYAKKMRGRKNGLISKGYQAYPEIIMFYENGFFISRASIKMEQVDRTYALFIQNNFTDNFHNVGGTLGWRKNNFRINISTGVGIPVISEKITFAGEITLGVVIPRSRSSEINPWSPYNKFY